MQPKGRLQHTRRRRYIGRSTRASDPSYRKSVWGRSWPIWGRQHRLVHWPILSKQTSHGEPSDTGHIECSKSEKYQKNPTCSLSPATIGVRWRDPQNSCTIGQCTTWCWWPLIGSNFPITNFLWESDQTPCAAWYRTTNLLNLNLT